MNTGKLHTRLYQTSGLLAEYCKQTKDENMEEVEPMDVDEDGEGKGKGWEGSETGKKKKEGKQEQGKEQGAGGDTGSEGEMGRKKLESDENTAGRTTEAAGVKRKFVDGGGMDTERTNVVEEESKADEGSTSRGMKQTLLPWAEKKGKEGEGKDIDGSGEKQGKGSERKVESGQEVGRTIKPKAQDYNTPPNKNYLQAYLEGLKEQVSRRHKETEDEQKEKEGQNAEEMKATEDRNGNKKQKDEERLQMEERGEGKASKEERRDNKESMDAGKEGTDQKKEGKVPGAAV